MSVADQALPSGWEQRIVPSGRVVYIDNNTRNVQWIHPSDIYTKPKTFSDCKYKELPYGWEESYNAEVGRYFLNHLNCTTTLHDPRTFTELSEDESQRQLSEFLITLEQTRSYLKEIVEKFAHQKRLVKELQTIISQIHDEAMTATGEERDLLEAQLSKLKVEFDEMLVKNDELQRKCDLETENLIALENIQDRLNNASLKKMKVIDIFYELDDLRTQLQREEILNLCLKRKIRSLARKIPHVPELEADVPSEDIMNVVPIVHSGNIQGLSRIELELDCQVARKEISKLFDDRKQLQDIEVKLEQGELDSNKSWLNDKKVMKLLKANSSSDQRESNFRRTLRDRANYTAIEAKQRENAERLSFKEKLLYFSMKSAIQ